MCISKERWESILTPRLVTVVERGIFWPEKVMLVMGDERIWCGVLTSSGGQIDPISIVSIPSRYQYRIHTSLVRSILYFKFYSCLQCCGFGKEETARSPDLPLLCQRRAGTL